MDKLINETPHNVRLTASEIANIWSQYQNDTMAICVYKYMLQIAEDVSIRPIVELALSFAESHILKIKANCVELSNLYWDLKKSS